MYSFSTEIKWEIKRYSDSNDIIIIYGILSEAKSIEHIFISTVSVECNFLSLLGVSQSSKNLRQNDVFSIRLSRHRSGRIHFAFQ